MKVEALSSVDPALKQVVTFPTNKNLNKTLDIIMTDLNSGYQEPTKLKAIDVDHEGGGVPSDHWGVEMRPRTNLTTTRAKPKKETFIVQPLPDSFNSLWSQAIRGRVELPAGWNEFKQTSGGI